MTIIEQIKAEIERLKGICTAQIKANPGQTFPFVMEMTGYDKLLSFLSTLESEKPMNQEGLEKEIKRYLQEVYDRDTTVGDVARHFAQWGAEHFRDLTKKIGDSSEIPADLEEAAEISFDEAKSLTEDYRDFLAKGLTENKPRPIGPHWFCEYAKNRFIAGAKWQAEQDQETIELAEDHAYLAGAVNEREKMMKEAVEGTIICYNDDTYAVESCCLDNKEHHHHSGDKVRIIIVKED